MLNLGMSELLLFAIIAVLVLGPEKLPTAIRSVMKWYRQIKMLMTNVQRDIERELEVTEIREKMEKEISRFREIEVQMQAQLNQIQKEVDQLEKNENPQDEAVKADLTTAQTQDSTPAQLPAAAISQIELPLAAESQTPLNEATSQHGYKVNLNKSTTQRVAPELNSFELNSSKLNSSKKLNSSELNASELSNAEVETAKQDLSQDKSKSQVIAPQAVEPQITKQKDLTQHSSLDQHEKVVTA